MVKLEKNRRLIGNYSVIMKPITQNSLDYLLTEKVLFLTIRKIKKLLIRNYSYILSVHRQYINIIQIKLGILPAYCNNSIYVFLPYYFF